MKSLAERLGKRKPLVAAAGFALLALIVLVALVMPKMSAVKSQQTLLDAAQLQGQQLTVQVAALQQAKADAATVRRQLSALDQQIPSTTQLPELIREIHRVADKAAVDFVQISPGVPLPSSVAPYSTMPTQISATGSYFAVTEFLYRLETLPRAVKVTTITLGPGPSGLPQLQLQISAEMYTTDMSAGPGSAPGPTSGTSGTTGTTGPTGPTGPTGTTTGTTGGA